MRVVALRAGPVADTCRSTASMKSSSCAGQVGREAGQRVAFDGRGRRLTHDGRAHHQAQRVESDSVRLRFGSLTRRGCEDAVVVDIAVTLLPSASRVWVDQQVIGVEVDDRVSPNRSRSRRDMKSAPAPVPVR